MSNFRRNIMASNTGSEVLDPNLIFYAPMTEGDLTDHVTGISMQLTGKGQIEWNNSLQIYKITTPSTTYDTVLTFRSNRYWKDLIQDDFTVCAKVCRFTNNYGTYNKARVFACSPVGSPTDAWTSYGMGIPANLFTAVGSSLQAATACGENYEIIYSFAALKHFTNNTNYQQTAYRNGIQVQSDSLQASKFTAYADEVNSGLNIGLTGHTNFRYCSFGIKDVRIYNKILTQEEINSLL